MDFIKKYWLWLALALVAVWYFAKKKNAANTGSAAAAVVGNTLDTLTASVNTIKTNVSTLWNDFGFA